MRSFIFLLLGSFLLVASATDQITSDDATTTATESGKDTDSKGVTLPEIITDDSTSLIFADENIESQNEETVTTTSSASQLPTTPEAPEEDPGEEDSLLDIHNQSSHSLSPAQEAVMNDLEEIWDYSLSLEDGGDPGELKRTLSGVVQLAYARVQSEPEDTLHRLKYLLEKLRQRIGVVGGNQQGRDEDGDGKGEILNENHESPEKLQLVQVPQEVVSSGSPEAIRPEKHGDSQVLDDRVSHSPSDSMTTAEEISRRSRRKRSWRGRRSYYEENTGIGEVEAVPTSDENSIYSMFQQFQQSQTNLLQEKDKVLHKIQYNPGSFQQNDIHPGDNGKPPQKIAIFVQNGANFVQNDVKFSQNSANFDHKKANFDQNSANFVQNSANFDQNSANFVQNSDDFVQNKVNFAQNGAHFAQNGAHFAQNSANLAQDSSNFAQDNANSPQKINKTSPNFNQNSANADQNSANVQNNAFASQKNANPPQNNGYNQYNANPNNPLPPNDKTIHKILMVQDRVTIPAIVSNEKSPDIPHGSYFGSKPSPISPTNFYPPLKLSFPQHPKQPGMNPSQDHNLLDATKNPEPSPEIYQLGTVNDITSEIVKLLFPPPIPSALAQAQKWNASEGGIPMQSEPEEISTTKPGLYPTYLEVHPLPGFGSNNNDNNNNYNINSNSNNDIKNNNNNDNNNVNEGNPPTTTFPPVLLNLIANLKNHTGYLKEYFSHLKPPVAMATPSPMLMAPSVSIVTPSSIGISSSVAMGTQSSISISSSVVNFPTVSMATPPPIGIFPPVSMVTPPSTGISSVSMATPPSKGVPPLIPMVTPLPMGLNPPVVMTTPPSILAQGSSMHIDVIKVHRPGTNGLLQSDQLGPMSSTTRRTPPSNVLGSIVITPPPTTMGQIVSELHQSNILKGPSAFMNGTREGLVQFIATLSTLSFTTKMIMVFALSISVLSIVLGVYSMGPPIIAVGILGIMIPIAILLLIQDPNRGGGGNMAQGKLALIDDQVSLILHLIDTAVEKYES